MLYARKEFPQKKNFLDSCLQPYIKVQEVMNNVSVSDTGMKPFGNTHHIGKKQYFDTCNMHEQILQRKGNIPEIKHFHEVSSFFSYFLQS
jgi:hypothetical protein